MSDAPNVENYTLGKGVVFFDEKNLTTGLYTGERDLGNAPAFAFNVAFEELKHFSSRGGLSAQDKKIISQITPAVSFTLDEINKENIAMLVLGNLTTVEQAALGSVADEEIVAHLGKRTDLSKRNIIYHTLPYDTGVGGAPAIGEVLTGAGGATAIILAITGATPIVDGTLTIAKTNTTSFVDDEQITSSGTFDADVNSAVGEVLGTGTPVIRVTNSAGDTEYEVGAEGVGNFQIVTSLKDHTIGRILINADQTSPTAAITEGDTLKVTFGYGAATYQVVQAFANTQLEGKLRFVSDNPVGTQQELHIWRCALVPAGDTAMIGDDWSTLGFTGEILKDESNADSPYMDIYMG